MQDQCISVIGGTGKLGLAVARRLTRAGFSVIVGSRSAESAAAAAAALGARVAGMTNAGAAAAADLIVVTVPFAAQEATLREIAPHAAGKIVVDTTVPLMPPKVTRVQLPPEGSAAVRGQRILGDGATIVAALHNVAAHKLATDEEIACDVLVFSDDKAARSTVIELLRHMGLKGLHGGLLVNAAAAEALTSVLIFLNRTYDVEDAGLKITGSLRETRP